MSDSRPPPVPVSATAAAALLDGAPLLRAINFHNTPASGRERYAAQLEGLGERYGPVDEDGLGLLLEGKALRHGRPGVLPVLYEGYRNQYEVALELIEREGLVAWLFVPSAFPGVAEEEQHAFAAAHDLDRAGGDPARVAMSWDELRDVVARGHVVACHTATHAGAADLLAAEDVERELAGSKRVLEEQLGIEVRSFAWLWGTPVGVHADLDARLTELGYRFVFSDTRIQRLAQPASTAPRTPDPRECS